MIILLKANSDTKGYQKHRISEKEGTEHVQGRESVILLPLTSVVWLPLPIFLPSMNVPFELKQSREAERE